MKIKEITMGVINSDVLLEGIILFVVTFYLSHVGALSRSYESLSLFWPVNAVLAGLMVRYTILDRKTHLIFIFLAMVCMDTLSGNGLWDAMNINLANIIFIALACYLIKSDVLFSWYKNYMRHRILSRRLINTLPACFIACALSALWGAIASDSMVNKTFAVGWCDWFTEQFATGMLFLPLMVTLPKINKIRLPRFSIIRIFSLLALMLSLVASPKIDGIIGLILPLPALLVCAWQYSFFPTALLTLLAGITQIVMVANHKLAISGPNTLISIDPLTLGRLIIAVMAICPLLVTINLSSPRNTPCVQ
jgi:hypothetical protein